MKNIRLFIFFLVSVIIVFAIMTFMLPVSQKLTRTITINSTAAVVYEYIEKIENFKKWSVWTQQDSTAIYTLTGTDGTVGAASEWKGHPQISGEGKIEITSLEKNHQVTQQFYFVKPKKASAISTIQLQETEKATTLVTWKFEMATPRPWNIFNLFSSLDKQVGKDFEKGLATLKYLVESGSLKN